MARSRALVSQGQVDAIREVVLEVALKTLVYLCVGLVFVLVLMAGMIVVGSRIAVALAGIG